MFAERSRSMDSETSSPMTDFTISISFVTLPFVLLQNSPHNSNFYNLVFTFQEDDNKSTTAVKLYRSYI